MKFTESLQNILNKTYEPSAMISMGFKGKNLAFKTNDEGNPILLFIGKLDGKGSIKGDRYVRTLKKDREGNTIKDHWERKGRAS